MFPPPSRPQQVAVNAAPQGPPTPVQSPSHHAPQQLNHHVNTHAPPVPEPAAAYVSPYLTAYTPQHSGHYAVHAAPVHASVVSSSRVRPAQQAAAQAHVPATPAPHAAASFTSPPSHSHSNSHVALRFGDSLTPSPTPSVAGDVGDPFAGEQHSAPASLPQTDDEDDTPDDLMPHPVVDATDLLARLCSAERIKADDLGFWRKCMDGMEWAFYDNQSLEVQNIVQQYCKSFVKNAARSRNLHALLLVICRHLENYSQTLHMMTEVGLATTNHLAVPSATSGSGGGGVGGSLLANLARDHPWVTQLIYFLRLVIQHVLSNLSYDETLRFFQHLAIPDAASKPGTPKTHTPSISLASYSQDTWAAGSDRAHLNRPRESASRPTTPPPMKNHMINLNPNSRRGSLNSQVDILTRFVCAIVNMLQVLGDAPLNAQVSTGKSAGASATKVSSPTNASAATAVIDLHLELLNTFFVLLSTQMYLPLSTDYEQVFLDRLMYCAKPPMLNSTQGFVTALIASFTEILPADWAETLAKKQAPQPKSIFGKLTSKLTSLLQFPMWAVRYLFTIPPNHPLIDRSTLLIELLVYQNNDNDFRTAIKNLRNSDPPRVPTAQTPAVAASNVAPMVAGDDSEEDLSGNTMLENLELGAISFDKLYYALCSTLLSEHINLFLYSLIHENRRFRAYLLRHHAHDLDYLLMPMLEILYREVDISKHHVYMIINVWILLTQQQGFDDIIKSIRVKEVPFFKEMVLKDLALTQVMQIVLLRTLQLNLRTKLKEPHIFNNCMPEDHQVLTDRGFLFLHEVETAFKDGNSALRVACYDAKTKQLEYHPINASDLVVKNGTHTMVDVASSASSKERSNVSVSVTADHDLFLRFGPKGYHKVPAGELLASEHTQFTMLAAATGGVAAAAPPSSPFYVTLGLDTPAMRDAFLQLYGYWLAAGRLADDALVFQAAKPRQVKYLRELMNVAGLVADLDSTSREEASLEGEQQTKCHVLSVHKAEWVALFETESRSSTSILRRLEAPQLRQMLKGMQTACGSTTANQGHVLRISSTLLRDEMVIALLHAGFSAHFVGTLAADGSSQNWTIHYSDKLRVTEPTMRIARDVSTRQLEGKVWCVTVPHSDHLIVVRRAEVDEKGLVNEASTPVIIGNCLASFCNTTITALTGPPTMSSSTAGTPVSSPPVSPIGGLAGSILATPLTLHPQVAFRLTRVLCILSRKFLVLQMQHEAQILDHNARVTAMQAEGREEITDDEERAEIELEEVAEELGTCMEFIQLLLEVVNHAIVHSLPMPHLLQPPSASAASSASSPPLTSLASNPDLLYNLIHSREYFTQLLPYAHLFEPSLISNVTNVIAFYAQASGVNIPTGAAGASATAGGQSGTGKATKQSVKEVAATVAALRAAIASTPMAPRPSAANSPTSPTAALPPGCTPAFDSSALIERGPFTYHEQENSQDFFIPYIYQLAQTMQILPKMYAPGAGTDPETEALGALTGTGTVAGTGEAINADEQFARELLDEEEHHDEHPHPSMLDPFHEDEYHAAEQLEHARAHEEDLDIPNFSVAIK